MGRRGRSGRLIEIRNPCPPLRVAPLVLLVLRSTSRATRSSASATDSRRHRMTQKPDPHAGNAYTTGRPDNWGGDEMRPDSGDHTEASPVEENNEVPAWNESQMAEQRPDGS